MNSGGSTAVVPLRLTTPELIKYLTKSNARSQERLDEILKQSDLSLEDFEEINQLQVNIEENNEVINLPPRRLFS